MSTIGSGTVTSRISTYGYIDVAYQFTQDDTNYYAKIVSVTYRNTRSNGTTKVYYGEIAIDITWWQVNTNKSTSGSYNYIWEDNYNRKIAKGTKSLTWTLNLSKTIPKQHYAQIAEIDFVYTGMGTKDGEAWYDGTYKDYPNGYITNIQIDQKPSYTISYANGGGGTAPAAQTKWYGEALTLRGAITRPNTSNGSYTVTCKWNNGTNDNQSSKSSARTLSYKFVNWKFSANSATYNASGSLPANVNSAGTMTAQWSSTESRANVTLDTPSRTNFAFVRWNTAQNNTGTGYNGGTTINPSSNMTLYAIWNRTLSYNGNGSGATNIPGSKTDLATNTITVAAGPTRPGYKFVSWNTKADGSGTTYNAGASYPAQGPTATLYAQWTPALSNATLGNLTIMRVATAAATTANDEGTYCWIKVPVNITGAAGASSTITASSSTATDISVVTPKTKAQTTGNDTVTVVHEIRAKVTSLEDTYTISFTVTVKSTNGNNAQTFTLNGTATVPTAYYTIAGRPGGKGISFGGVPKQDTHNINMKTTHYQHATMQVHVFNNTTDATNWANANPSALPIVALITADNSLWRYY